MTDALRVLLEIGTKGRRVVAAATDWPGLDRWGKSEDEAVETLTSYLPRYAGVADRAGLASSFATLGSAEVIERYRGSSSTDFWGVSHVPSVTEADVPTAKDLDRRLDLLQACWAYFDDVAAQVSAELRRGPRGGGRSRDEIIRHVYASERHNFWRKVAIREDDGGRLTPDGLSAHRARYLDAIRAYNADGRPARSWPIQFLIRRTANHVMDHAWEMEDKDLTG